jgi:hypothetical protein
VSFLEGVIGFLIIFAFFGLKIRLKMPILGCNFSFIKG